MVGFPRPASILETVSGRTPAALATAFWVSPARVLFARKILPADSFRNFRVSFRSTVVSLGSKFTTIV